jgi:hypothetical protein
MAAISTISYTQSPLRRTYTGCSPHQDQIGDPIFDQFIGGLEVFVDAVTVRAVDRITSRNTNSNATFFIIPLCGI